MWGKDPCYTLHMARLGRSSSLRPNHVSIVRAGSYNDELVKTDVLKVVELKITCLCIKRQCDPEHKKPEGYDDIPKEIVDRDAKKPEDLDDEEVARRVGTNKYDCCLPRRCIRAPLQMKGNFEGKGESNQIGSQLVDRDCASRI